nr:Pullulanase precursor [Klebsiella pneumoniae]
MQASAVQAVIHLVDIAGITSSTPADYATKTSIYGTTKPVTR